jgi:hypothetical protein
MQFVCNLCQAAESSTHKVPPFRPDLAQESSGLAIMGFPLVALAVVVMAMAMFVFRILMCV